MFKKKTTAKLEAFFPCIHLYYSIINDQIIFQSETHEFQAIHYLRDLNS